MRRNFLRGFLICLIPTLLAGLFVGLGFQKESKGEIGFRRGIDLAGGTILIYEIDKDKLPANWDAEQIKKLADKLKKRIDENDLYNVVVRPLGLDRVEIILPLSGSASGEGKGSSDEFIDGVRQKVKQTGKLEFRIVANSKDDARAWEEAQKIIDQADPGTKEELKRLAEQGKPPLAPTGSYTVRAAGDSELPATYAWVELGKEERESLALTQKYDGKPKVSRSGGREFVSDKFDQVARRRGQTISEQGSGKSGTYDYLLYSREFIKKEPSAEEKGKKVEYFVLTRNSDGDRIEVSGDVQVSASSDRDEEGKPAVGFAFTNGGRIFEEMTRRNRAKDGRHRNMAVIMDDKIVSMPYLNEPLPGKGIISGNMDQKTVNQQVSILRSGSLTASLKPDPVSENSIGSTLGEQTKRNGLIAVAASFAVVMLFMVFYYRFAGFVACVALFVNLLMTVGFMQAMNAAFTLPGLAGIVLMLGMAVDANVLIYERLREEREKGATLLTAIRNGYDRALPTIIDTHLTSIFTAIVMYTFGNDALKGFSVSLTVGLIISLFTSLYITRLMFDYWVAKKWLTELKMLKLFAKPKFDFMKIRNFMFWLTTISTVVGLGLFIFRGEKVLNVDFTQGTVYGGRLAKDKQKSLTEMSELLGEGKQSTTLKVRSVSKVPTTTVTQIYDVIYEDGQSVTISLANPPEGTDDATKLANLKDRLERLQDVSIEQVFLVDDRDLGFGKSRSFTVRTTEKEKEIVQVSLDRLLRDGNDNLLKSLKVGAFEVTGPTVKVTFEGGENPTDNRVAPSYFRDFVLRALKAQSNEAPDEASTVIVTGVPSENQDEAAAEGQEQKYRTLLIDVSKNPTFEVLGKEGGDKMQALNALKSAITEAKKSFDARPVPERLETFDPALAKDTRTKALLAILASWAAILVYLWFRFGSWQFGLAAVICLIHDLCFTLGAIAVCHYLSGTLFGHALGLHDFKIDLTAVAALLTLVGYSVNDTIVVFDRIREVRGKSPVLTAAMINQSVNETLSRTVLAALTVFLVVVVLYIFGGDGVHLFSFVMIMGVIVGTYSSIYIASPLLLIFGEGKHSQATTYGLGSSGGNFGNSDDEGTGEDDGEPKIDPVTGQPNVALPPVSAIPS